MKRLLKWVGIILGSVVGLALIAGAVLYVVGGNNIAAAHEVSVGELSIPADSASVAHGARLAGIFGCRDCHGDDLAGNLMGDAPPFRLDAPNLTPAGAVADYSAADWDRAIRHGVRPNGTALFVMPSGAYNKLSDADAAALIAYLQTLEPIASEHGSIEWKPMGRLLAAGAIDVSEGVYESTSGPATSPTPDSTAAYGAYMAGMTCAYCHGENLDGKEDPGSGMLAPDLRASAGWTAEQFHQALTTGELPSGHAMDPEVMPWTATAYMTEVERESLRQYLIALVAEG
ncbi:MAG: c-type cytochrome [Rubricoccaceae bacterium]